MRVAIMTRLDTIDDIKIQKYLETIEEVLNELKYKCVIGTLGKHREARYSHSHIHLICETGNAKCYKELAQKINNMSIVRKYREVLVGKALAFNYNDGQPDKKGHLYDEDKILQYPLKEYTDNTSMVQDMILDTTLLGEPDWEKYRRAANDLWSKSRVAKKKIEKEERIGMYEYLDTQVLQKWVQQEDVYSDYERKEIMQWTMENILKWYKQEEKKFNLAALKNQAANYLYFAGIFSEYDIIGLVVMPR